MKSHLSKRNVLQACWIPLTLLWLSLSVVAHSQETNEFSLPSSGTMSARGLQPDGKILVAGSYISIDNQP